jgi:23S rRNA pseudouridine1911/1915/1917 synthase
MVRTIVTDRGDAGRRLDLVLMRHLAGVEGATRSRVQRWIVDGQVSVNGRIVRRVSSRPAIDAAIAVALPPPAAPRRLAISDVALDVLYEDEHFIAVNKPPGLVAHPTHAHADGTLLNALAGLARTWPAGQRPSLLNRLDKLTSGVVLVARTAAVHAALQRALASSAAEKDYLAIVYGRPPARGSITLRLQRDTVDRRRVVASETAGAPSTTRFERLETTRIGTGVWLSLVRCRLVTGRTHQIRVHLAARGWPIAGDPVYGEPRWEKVEDDDLRNALRTFPRQALHAWRIALPHPFGGHRKAIEAPLPQELAALAERFYGSRVLRFAGSGNRRTVEP